jgi:Ca-activated chloride channel family protein
MIRFAHSEYLYALLLLPGCVLLFWWAMRSRKKLMSRFGSAHLLERLTPSAARYKHYLKFVLVLAAVAFVVIGIANPQIGTKMEEVRREGVDIFIALDVSNSMTAEDIRPNRLQSAVREISQLLDRLQNDRIGIIVFAGDSYLQLPLTDDYGAARMMLSTIDIDIVPIQGTAIGSAMKLAMKSFVEGEKKHKAIVIITDGENHEDDAISAAKEAASEGVVVHTIGMGSPAGAPIPVYQNGGQIGFKKDAGGNVVVTKLDEAGLQQIADAGDGKYFRASSQQNELDAVFADIQAMEKKEFGAKVFTDYQDRFQYLLAVALLLIVLEFFISERRNALFERWRKLLGHRFTLKSGGSVK